MFTRLLKTRARFCRLGAFFTPGCLSTDRGGCSFVTGRGPAGRQLTPSLQMAFCIVCNVNSSGVGLTIGLLWGALKLKGVTEMCGTYRHNFSHLGL